MTRWRSIPIALLLLLAGAAKGQDRIEPSAERLDVTPPRSAENLTVLLICSDAADPREYITLPEGTSKRYVTVRESPNVSVGTLIVDNLSSSPLFIQEGERLKGGQQDRIAKTTVVVPPKTRAFPLPACCVESGRWSSGREFRAGFVALAPKGVRRAAKIEGNQRTVWQRVAEEKAAANRAYSVPNSGTSLNEMMDHPDLARRTGIYRKTLVGKMEIPKNAIGVAFFVNGRLEEVNLYCSPALLKQMYPRLLETYAVCALLARREPQGTHGDVAKELAALLRRIEWPSERGEISAAGMMIAVARLTDGVCADVRHKGSWVHRQWMSGGIRTPRARP